LVNETTIAQLFRHRLNGYFSGMVSTIHQLASFMKETIEDTILVSARWVGTLGPTSSFS